MARGPNLFHDGEMYAVEFLNSGNEKRCKLFLTREDATTFARSVRRPGEEVTFGEPPLPRTSYTTT